MLKFRQENKKGRDFLIDLEKAEKIALRYFELNNLGKIHKMYDSQLPRPIKGTGLAKGLNPLYLSEVCSSCIWS